MTMTDANMPGGRGREATGHGVSGRPAPEEPSKGSDAEARAAAGEAGLRPGGEEQPATRRPSFTITDAAVACVVSRKTITRKLPELATHGAAKDADGIWRIPVEALLAVGLHPGRSMPTERRPAETLDLRQVGSTDPAPPRSTGPELITIPRDRWDDVRIRLARAEAEAAERALALADARLALRALTAAPSRGSTPAHSEPAPQGAWYQPGADGPPATAVVDGSGRSELSSGRASVGDVAGTAASEAVQDGLPGVGPSGTPAWDAILGNRPDVPPSPAGGTAQAVIAMEPTDLFIARSRVARSGQVLALGPEVLTSVPVAGSAPRKRRWWQSR